MKTKLLISFLLFFFLLPNSVHATFDSFVKYENNPLNKSDLLQHHIEYENSQFKMWYSTFSGDLIKIAKATSSNGFTWNSGNIININEPNNYHDPNLINISNGKALYYVTSASGQNYKIKRAESADGLSFNNISEILTPQQSWENNAVSCPFVAQNNGIFYLFYCGWNGQSWAIGLATSSDGINFNRCSTNPLLDINGNTIPGGNSFLIKKDGKYYLFFHTWYASGIDIIESSDPIGCSMRWENRRNLLSKNKPYDQNHMIAPSVVEKGGQTYLFYTGLGTDNVWRLNVALSGQPVQQKKPIVLVPGFFGSWNKEAVLHDKSVDTLDWKLNPVIHEYDGLIGTFKNLGLTEGQDFLVFPYDWRKKLDDSATDLKNFMSTKIVDPNSKVELVGHSLGGLVSRVYTQKFADNRTDKIITVGSPHQGLPAVYKAVEAGDLERDDSLFWLIQRMLLVANKKGLESDKDTITRILPVAKNVFPTYNFLKNNKGEEISVTSMVIKNDSLANYNSSVSSIFNLLQTFAGVKGPTTYGYNVEPRSLTDELLGIYPDGRPTSSFAATGDLVVPFSSAILDSDYVSLDGNHGEIISKSQGIKEILKSLEIPFSDSQIIESSPTKISPSILLVIKSPAEMEVIKDNISYKEKDGMILIENATDGNYILKVKGKENGIYTAFVGLIGESKESFNQITGQITKNPPQLQIDQYEIFFNKVAPAKFFINQNDINSLFDQPITTLAVLNKSNNYLITKAKLLLSQAKQDYNLGYGDALKNDLVTAHFAVYSSRTKGDLELNGQLLEVVNKIENLYDRVFSPDFSGKLKFAKPQSPASLKASLLQSLQAKKNEMAGIEYTLWKQKKLGMDVTYKSLLVPKAKEKLALMEEALAKNNLPYAEILNKSLDILFGELR